MKDIALSLKKVHKNFGQTAIIKGVDLDIFEDERHAIIGPNGAGKSTLFNLISGRFPLSSGNIEMQGKDITNMNAEEINRKGLSRSFQITNIFPRMTVYENIRCSVLWIHGLRYSFWQNISTIKNINDKTEEIIELIGMSKIKNNLAGELTYAEQRALEIGGTIASGAKIILLDEPTAGMSRSESDEAVELVKKVSEKKTLIMVEHDMSVVFNIADRITVLVYGEIIATGPPDEIRSNMKVQEAYLGTEQSNA